MKYNLYSAKINYISHFLELKQLLLMEFQQILIPNIAQTRFVSKEYALLVVQPLHKTKRHRCPKRF